MAWFHALYGYLGLILPGLLLFRLAATVPAKEPGRGPDQEADDDTPPSWRMLLLGGLGLVVVLAAFATALALAVWLLGSIVLVLVVLAIGWTCLPRIRGLWKQAVEPRLGSRPKVSTVATYALSSACGAAWLLYPSWITYDATFLLLATDGLRSVSAYKLSLRLVLVFLAALVVYDIWGVWGSGVIVQVATGLASHPLPLMFTVPAHPLSWSLEPVVALGVGDYLISGVLIVTLARYGLRNYAIAGFCLGVLGALLVPAEWVPATITLAPAILGSAGIGYLWQRRKPGRGRCVQVMPVTEVK